MRPTRAVFAPFFGLNAVQRFSWQCSVCFFKIALWAADCSYTVLHSKSPQQASEHAPAPPPSPSNRTLSAMEPRHARTAPYIASKLDLNPFAQVVGLDNLDQSEHYFFASNHESHFDVCLIFSTLPFWLISVAKKSLLYVPIFGWAVAAGGTVWVDRKNTKNAVSSMTSAAQSLTKRPGRNVIVFPEGTRTRDGNLQPFKKGGIVLAIQTGMPIVPVCVTGTMNVVPKGGRWVTPKQKLAVIYGKPIPTAGLTYDDRDMLCKKLEDAVAELKKAAPKYVGRNTLVEPFWRCFISTKPCTAKDAWGRVPA
jgi:1-acyl-sn-glycerol-3-phosphate acyltransferase